MVSIIGLLAGKTSLYRSIKRLEEAGLAENRMHIISQENNLRKLFSCQPKCVVYRYTIAGASIGIAIFGVFGLLTGLYHYTLLNYGLTYPLSTTIGGILSGILVGGTMGYLVGVSALEKDMQPYLEGARTGGQVISIQIDEEAIEEIKNILEQENALGVRVLKLPDSIGNPL
jgi:hypothetical protein